jgi:sugar/nucleoside kinase (ribokinase family)
MAGIRLFEEQLQLATPHTFNALTKLVMAMADVTKSAGKRTFLGRDKGQEAYSRFLEALKKTLHAMVLDGVIREATPSEEVAKELEEKLEKFSMAFPNWPDAYAFTGMFLGQQRKDAVATIERLRGTP